MKSLEATRRTVTPNQVRFFCVGVILIAALVLRRVLPLWITTSIMTGAALGLLHPPTARPATVIWIFLAQYFGALLSDLVLVVVYFGVLTPVAMLKRVFGREMPMRPESDSATYWTEESDSGDEPRRAGSDDPEHYYRQF